jgi:RNA polymerase sigma factor (sigma-70 family)
VEAWPVEALPSPSCPARPRRFDRASVRRSVEPRADEVEWMTAIATRGDRAAFAQLFRRYAPKIKAHLLARGAAAGAADELTQEAMLIVWRKAGLYDASRGSVAAWLYTISRNSLFNATRGERRRKGESTAEMAFPDVAPPPTSEQALLAAEQGRALSVSLAQLPPEQREILEGAYWRGQTLQECAEERQLPLGTVKTRVRLALERLRGLMKIRSME